MLLDWSVHYNFNLKTNRCLRRKEKVFFFFFLRLSVLVGACLQPVSSVSLRKTNFNLDTMMETEKRKVTGWTTPFPFKGLVQQHKTSSCVTCKKFNNSTCGKLFKLLFFLVSDEFLKQWMFSSNFLQPPCSLSPWWVYIRCLYHSRRFSIYEINHVYDALCVNRNMKDWGEVRHFFILKHFI